MRNYQPYLENSIIYQINLRSFTNEGTLNGAEKMLPHLKNIGVDIVYLCPCFVADNDMNGWSERQQKSKTFNPKNPYRISDYYNVDPEYGTNEDLKAFIKRAHELELRVLLDLVYFHCGPNAVFLKDHPDFIRYNADGSRDAGEWNFPKLNFDNPNLREYLINNMETFVTDYEVDGFRCDVGDNVPLDFWAQARERVDKLNPNLMMLNEGKENSYLDVFDLNYCWHFRRVFYMPCMQDDNATFLIEGLIEFFTKDYEANANHGALFLENHDIANDYYDNRIWKQIGQRATDALLVANFTLPYVPFVYMGTEIADTHQHTVFGNRFYAGNYLLDWQNALTKEGQERLELFKALTNIRHTIPAFGLSGKLEFVATNNKEVFSFIREKDGEKYAVLVNLSKREQKVESEIVCSKAEQIFVFGEKIEIQNGKLYAEFEPYGYSVIKL